MEEKSFPKMKISKQIQITHIISTFYYRSPDNFSTDGESHDFWEFIYVDKGEVCITAGEQKYILKTGELAFHCPNEFHAVSTQKGINSNFIICAFECKSVAMKYFTKKILTLNSFERQCLYQAVDYASKFITVDNPHKIRDLHYENPPFGSMQMWSNNIEQLLLSLYCRKDDIKIQQRIETYLQQATSAQLAKKIEEYLEANISKPIKLQNIADELCCSVPQAEKMFRLKYGCGIIEYSINLKINEAKRMIRQGTYSFTEISSLLGYENNSYFSRLFKKRVKMTMTDFSKSSGR